MITLKIGGKISDFVKYKDFAYKTNSNTFQMPNRTCGNCHVLLHWPNLEKDFLDISLRNSFSLIQLNLLIWIKKLIKQWYKALTVTEIANYIAHSKILTTFPSKFSQNSPKLLQHFSSISSQFFINLARAPWIHLL